MSRLGADVAELEAIATELEGYARRIVGACEGINRELTRTSWSGPDADSFRRRWHAIAVRDLDGFRSDLESSATELRRQAMQQRIASSDGPGAASGLVVGAATGASAANVGRGTSWNDAKVAVGRVATAVGGVLTLAGHIPTKELGHLAASGRFDQVSVADLEQVRNTKHPLATKHTMSHAATVLSFGTAAITAGFARWEQDTGTDLSTSQRLARGTTEGVVHGAAIVGGSKVGLAAGAVVGGTIGFAIGGPVGAVIGAKLGAAGGSYLGSKAASSALETELGQQATEAVVDFAGDAAGAAEDFVSTTASSAVDAVGGAVDSVKGWFK